MIARTPSGLAGRKVLVLGGMGFIGSNLAMTCATHGAEVTVFDSLSPHAGGNTRNIADSAAPLRIVRGDIQDANAVAAVVREQDIVYNCAALSSHPHSMRHPIENVNVNCSGVLTVLEALRANAPTARLVQVGTSTQIGPMRQSPITEEHAEFPADIYSANKTAGEKYTLIYHRAHGVRATVVRLANTYGPRASIRSPEFGFVNYFIGLALRGETLTVYGDGQQSRNISFVADSVDALIQAGLADEAIGEVFFATADEQVTVREVAESIASVVGGAVHFVPWPAERAAIEIGDAVISNAKIRSRLGWRPTHSLVDGLAQTRDYYASRLKDYL
jgi:UDP-glucose 4-epimerase